MYRTSLYLAASASAEFFADIALAPMEAVKVRIQTQPGWANNLREGVPKLWRNEGISGYVAVHTTVLCVLSLFNDNALCMCVCVCVCVCVCMRACVCVCVCAWTKP